MLNTETDPKKHITVANATFCFLVCADTINMNISNCV